MRDLKSHTGDELEPLAWYLSPDGQRLYRATPRRLWFNKSQRDDHGRRIRDFKHEISIEELVRSGEPI